MFFKDHFSDHSKDYQSFRPHYPDSLFKYLASRCRQHGLAWDCATGSGQAAVHLARYFQSVVATDASESQIRSAVHAQGVQYEVGSAEQSVFQAESVDLITVAQALHWFDHDLFFSEVHRVLKSRGLLAVWTYDLLTVAPEIDKQIELFYKEILNGCWPQERKWVEEQYTSISFPYPLMPYPAFDMSASWNLKEFIGYLNTWSAVKEYYNQHQTSPVDKVYYKLSQVWGEENQRRSIHWPLTLKLGTKP